MSEIHQRRFSLAVESPQEVSPVDVPPNRPLVAFLIDMNHPRLESSTPNLLHSPSDRLGLHRSLSEPGSMNNYTTHSYNICKLVPGSVPMAKTPDRRYSVYDLNSSSKSTSDNNLFKYTQLSFNHHRRNSVALKFQNPKFVDNSAVRYES